jgi:hypothetical protein
MFKASASKYTRSLYHFCGTVGRQGTGSGQKTSNGSKIRREESTVDNTPRKKMGKRARKALDASKRRTWQVPPVTKLVPSKKLYDRKRRRPDEDAPPSP